MAGTERPQAKAPALAIFASCFSSRTCELLAFRITASLYVYTLPSCDNPLFDPELPVAVFNDLDISSTGLSKNRASFRVSSADGTK
jgi:hypothetical protein